MNKKIKSVFAIVLTLVMFAAMAMGCGDDDKKSSSSGSSKSDSYGGYSKDYWDAARAGWEAGGGNG